MGGFSCYKHEVFTITRNATTAAAVDQSNDTDSAQPNTIDGKACPFVDGDHRKIPCVCNVSATIDSENGRLSLLPDAVKMSVTEGSDGNAGAGAGTGADVRHVDIHVNHIHEYDGSGRIVRSFDTSSRSHNASWVVSGVVHTRYQGASCTQTTATLIVPLHNQNAEYTSLDTTDNNNPDPVDDIAANPFSLRLEIYTFKEVGLLKAGEEASLVFPGSVKINIQLLHWNFGLAATRLDINMIISTQTSSPLFSPPPSLPSLLLNSSAAEYTMSGFGLVTFSAVAECDGVWKSIPAPVYSRNTTVWRTNDGTANNSSETVTYFNHNQHYILTFPVFENSLYYDPIVHLAFVNAALSTGMYSEAIRELRDANTTKENDDSNSDTATLKLIFLMCAAFLFFIVGSISCYTVSEQYRMRRCASSFDAQMRTEAVTLFTFRCVWYV